MKTSTSLANLQKRNDCAFDVSGIRSAVHSALVAVEGCRQKCLIAGSMLNDVQQRLPHGEFEDWVKNYIPEISERTAQYWARAAMQVVKVLPALPQGAIDVESTVSAILSAEDADLSEGQREWKQQWLDFTADKTIKDCLDGVFVEGDPAHRVDRAVNGKTKGGRGNAAAPGRKEFPLFVTVKLKDIGRHLEHWRTMTELQRTDIKTAFRAAILGSGMNFRDHVLNTEMWPEDLCKAAIEALKERLKGNRS